MPISELLLHQATSKKLESIAAQPSQGYLFSGPVGSGKQTAATLLAQQWSRGDSGLVHIVASNDKSIGIDKIHALKPLVQGRVSAGQRRTIIVDQADRLTREAQNSLLKLLEEPPVRTTFILITQDGNRLLPTIRSRLFSVEFNKLKQEDLVNWFVDKTGGNIAEAARFYHLGDYTPGGMMTVKNNPEKDIEIVGIAKQFITSGIYERTILLATIQKKDKPDVDKFLSTVAKLLSLSLKVQARSNANSTSVMQISHKLNLVLRSRKLLAANVNSKLILSQLVVEL